LLALTLIAKKNSTHRASLTRWLFHLVGIPTAHLANNLPHNQPGGDAGYLISPTMRQRQPHCADLGRETDTPQAIIFWSDCYGI
jgi:hypothetical protein